MVGEQSTPVTSESVIGRSYAALVFSLICVTERSRAEDILDAMEAHLKGKENQSDQVRAFTVATINNAREALRKL